MTMPVRWLSLGQSKRSKTVPIAILYYHRVDNSKLNPWTISNHRFQEQLDWLQQKFDLVSLEEVQRRMRSGSNDRPTVSITFDDGYADNCTEALPLLIRRKIPFTYFVTSQNTINNIPFPHDVARNEKLAPDSVDSLKALYQAGVEIGGHTKTHPNLGQIHDKDQLADEVIGGAQELEKAIGCRVRYFAFPFGMHENLNRDVFRLCHDHGFAGVCSAYGGWNEISDDAFHLHRFHGDPRTATLKNWLTLDPRKRSVKKYQTGLESNENHSS